MSRPLDPSHAQAWREVTGQLEAVIRKQPRSVRSDVSALECGKYDDEADLAFEINRAGIED